MAEKDIIVNIQVNTGDSSQKVEALAKAEKDLAIGATDANQAIKQTTATTNASTQATEQAVTANISLKKQLRGLQEELGQLAVAGKQNTAEYKKLKEEAGRLKDAVSDVSDEIAQAGSDTRGLDQTIRVATVATAGFAILEGATALFGKENEELQKTLLKVTAAVSILSGLQEIQAEINRKDSLFTKAAAAAKLIYATAVGTATGATKIFRIALFSLGIGAIIVLIGLLIANFDKISAAVKKIIPGLGDFQRGLDQTKTVLRGFSEAALSVLTKVVKTLFIIPRTLFALFNEGVGGAIKVVQETAGELGNLFGDAAKAYDKGAAAQNKLNAESQKTRDTLAQIKKLNTEILRIEANGGDARKTQLQKARLELSLLTNGTNEYFEKLKEVNDIQRDLSNSGKVVVEKNKEIAKSFKDNISEIQKYSNELKSTEFGIDGLDAQIKLLDQLIFKFPEYTEIFRQSQREIQNLLVDANFKPEPIPITFEVEGEEDLKTKIQGILNKQFEQEKQNKADLAKLREQEKQQAIQSAFFAASQIQDITQRAFSARQQLLDNQLKQGLISEQKYAEETKKIKIKEAKAAKAFAIFEATINIANAIVSALKAGPAAPFLVALIAALGAAQIALIAATPIPKFFKGAIDLKRGAFPQGRDTIPAMLNEGESVMTTAETRKYKDVFTHIRNNTFEKIYLPKMAYKLLNIPNINTAALSNIRLSNNGSNDQKIFQELQMLRLYMKENNNINRRTANNTSELKKPSKRRFSV